MQDVGRGTQDVGHWTQDAGRNAGRGMREEGRGMRDGGRGTRDVRGSRDTGAWCYLYCLSVHLSEPESRKEGSV